MPDPVVRKRGGKNCPSYRQRDSQADILADLAADAIREAIQDEGVRPDDVRVRTRYVQGRTEPHTSFGEAVVYDDRDLGLDIPQGVLDLKFAHANVGMVLDGDETATVRYDYEHDVEAGDVLRLRTPGERVFAIATVTKTTTTPISRAYFALETMDASHPADNWGDLLNRLEHHYPDAAPLTPDDEVQVIGFELTATGPGGGRA